MTESALWEAYWYPLYTYLRRTGASGVEAESLTRALLGRKLQERGPATADPEWDRFRTYVLGSVRHFLESDWQCERADAGDCQPAVSIDFDEADRRYGRAPDEPSSPEHAFDRQWALTVLGRTMDWLRAEYDGQGKIELFQGLSPALLGGADPPNRTELAATLRMSAGAFNTELHRLRRRFQTLLRAEAAHTVSDAADVEDELRFLRGVLSGRKRPE